MKAGFYSAEEKDRIFEAIRAMCEGSQQRESFTSELVEEVKMVMRKIESKRFDFLHDHFVEISMKRDSEALKLFYRLGFRIRDITSGAGVEGRNHILTIDHKDRARMIDIDWDAENTSYINFMMDGKRKCVFE